MDELIKAAREWVDANLDGNCKYSTGDAVTAEHCANFHLSQQAAQWVPANSVDDLPKEDGEYWFSWDDGEVQQNFLDRRHLTPEGFASQWKGVTAWQPINTPAPYKPEDTQR